LFFSELQRHKKIKEKKKRDARKGGVRCGEEEKEEKKTTREDRLAAANVDMAIIGERGGGKGKEGGGRV